MFEDTKMNKNSDFKARDRLKMAGFYNPKSPSRRRHSAVKIRSILFKYFEPHTTLNFLQHIELPASVFPLVRFRRNVAEVGWVFFNRRSIRVLLPLMLFSTISRHRLHLNNSVELRVVDLVLAVLFLVSEKGRESVAPQNLSVEVGSPYLGCHAG